MLAFIVKVDFVNRRPVKVKGDMLVTMHKTMEDSPTEEMSAKGSSPSSALIRSFLPFLTLPRFRTVKRSTDRKGK